MRTCIKLTYDVSLYTIKNIKSFGLKSVESYGLKKVEPYGLKNVELYGLHNVELYSLKNVENKVISTYSGYCFNVKKLKPCMGKKKTKFFIMFYFFRKMCSRI